MKGIMISNCLFEEVKAKLRNPQNVKIHYFLRDLREGNSILPHFWWSEKGKSFHFKKTSNSKQPFWSKVKYRIMTLKLFIMIEPEKLLKQRYIKTLRKYGIEDPLQKLEWFRGKPKVDSENHYVAYNDRTTKKVIIRLVKKEDLNKYPFSYWRVADEFEVFNLVVNEVPGNEDGRELNVH